MLHRRSPTLGYPSIHATLALRHPVPTLLSPLRSIANTPPHNDSDAFDDFQSNAWIGASSYRPPLTGLGITCVQNASPGQPLSPEDPALRILINDDDLFPVEICGPDARLDDFLASTVSYRGLESAKDRRLALRTSGFDPSFCGEAAGELDLGLNHDIEPPTNDTIGLIPDVNMYDKLWRLDLPHPGVNPLDTIGGTSLHDHCAEPTSLRPQDHCNDILSAADSRIGQSPSLQVIQDIMSILTKPTSEFSFPPWPPAKSSSAQSFSPSQLRPSALINFASSNVSDSEQYTLSHLEYHQGAIHSSPILNAHLGIELNELIARAERFKTKFPERDIDRTWLSHFAGKLSDRGELLSDFRCYVVGCDQRNKRRDHILVHVGAHIGQRPFACSVCPLRFLRKNECKRHEASHSGFRPYSCDICGQSFVRQDLVKRHVKRTHGLRDENDSGVGKRTRKRARLH